MNDSTYVVYMHRNKINKKEYIGLSKNNPQKRWGFEGKGYGNQIIGKAIQKYGWDNFDHIILHENLTKDEAGELEQYYIYEHDTLIPHGYNVTPGGECGSSFPIICVETEQIFRDFDEAVDFYQYYFDDYPETLRRYLLDCTHYERKYIRIYNPTSRYLDYHFQYYRDYIKFPSNYSVHEKINKIEERCIRTFESRKWEYASIYYLGIPDSLDSLISIQTPNLGCLRMCKYCGRLFKPKEDDLNFDDILNKKLSDDLIYCDRHIMSKDRL